MGSLSVSQTLFDLFLEGSSLLQDSDDYNNNMPIIVMCLKCHLASLQ